MRSVRLLLLALACSACKEEAGPAVTDAGPVSRAIGAADVGVFVTLPLGWVEDPIEAKGLGAENAPTAGAVVVTVAQAHRVPAGRRFLVAPKIAVTVEPTVRRSPQEVFDQTLADLKKVDAAENAGLTRSALSSRFVGREQVGDLEVAYILRAGKAAKEIVQRSLIVLRSPPQGSRAIVTVTATYLAEDTDLVGAEVQAIMSSIRLEGAMAVE